MDKTLTGLKIGNLMAIGTASRLQVTGHDKDVVDGLLNISKTKPKKQSKKIYKTSRRFKPSEKTLKNFKMPSDNTKLSGGGLANDRKYSRRRRSSNGRRKIKGGVTSLTLDTFHLLSGWLKELAPLNILDIWPRIDSRRLQCYFIRNN